jgi:hypothetical protein
VTDVSDGHGLLRAAGDEPGAVLALDEQEDLHAVDLDLGTREWVIPAPGARGLAIGGSTAIVGQRDGLIRALSVSSGHEPWAVQ